jgi:hypothetical protein
VYQRPENGVKPRARELWPVSNSGFGQLAQARVAEMEPDVLGWSLIAAATVVVGATLAARRRGLRRLSRLGSVAVIAMLVGLPAWIVWSVLTSPASQG